MTDTNSKAQVTDAIMTAAMEVPVVAPRATYVRRIVLAALAAQEKPEPGVAVKALEWEDCTDGDCGWCSDTILGRYWVDVVHGKWLARLVTTVMETQDEIFLIRGVGFEQARDAVQADYEQRIRSALVSTQAQAVGWRWKHDLGVDWQFVPGPDMPELGFTDNYKARVTFQPLYLHPAPSPDLPEGEVK